MDCYKALYKQRLGAKGIVRGNKELSDQCGRESQGGYEKA